MNDLLSTVADALAVIGSALTISLECRRARRNASAAEAPRRPSPPDHENGTQ
ncbi:hypothetical protein [Streptomyces sp. NPDC055107]